MFGSPVVTRNELRGIIEETAVETARAMMHEQDSEFSITPISPTFSYDSEQTLNRLGITGIQYIAQYVSNDEDFSVDDAFQFQIISLSNMMFSDEYYFNAKIFPILQNVIYRDGKRFLYNSEDSKWL